MLRVANRYSACQSTLGEDHSRRERLIETQEFGWNLTLCTVPDPPSMLQQ
jgi:hypothetical protein